MADPMDIVTEFETQEDLARHRSNSGKYTLYRLLYKDESGVVQIEEHIGADCAHRQVELGLFGERDRRAVGYRLDGGGVSIDTTNDELRELLETHFRKR